MSNIQEALEATILEQTGVDLNTSEELIAPNDPIMVAMAKLLKLLLERMDDDEVNVAKNIDVSPSIPSPS